MKALIRIFSLFLFFSNCALAAPLSFELANLKNEKISISSFRGEWVILNFWASWCKPCVKEMPELIELHEADNQLTVLAINFENASLQDKKAFVEKHHMTMPVLQADPFQLPDNFPEPFVLPTTLLVDPEGMIQKTFRGPVTGEQLFTAFQAVNTP